MIIIMLMNHNVNLKTLVPFYVANVKCGVPKFMYSIPTFFSNNHIYKTIPKYSVLYHIYKTIPKYSLLYLFDYIKFYT